MNEPKNRWDNLGNSHPDAYDDIEFVGIDGIHIDDITKRTIKSSVLRSFKKIEAIIQQDATLKVHVKRQFASQEHKRHKYSVVIHLHYPGSDISVENVKYWDIKETINMAMKDMETRINRIFRSSGAESRNSVGINSKEQYRDMGFT